MASPVLIGFDLATRVGYCAGTGDRLPVVDSFVLPATGADVGRYLLESRGYFRLLLDRFGPSVVVYEAPVTTPQMTPEVTTKLHALPGVLEMECVERGLKVQKVYPSTLKARIGGGGRSSKEDVMAAVRRAGMTPKNKDESDAAAVWLCAVQHYNPATWPMWEARIKGLNHDLP